MIKNYLKIAWRNLVKNKTHTFINVAGLSVGMALAMLIGLWIWDELSYNKYYDNYDHIARVMQNQTNNGEIQTMPNEPLPLGNELRSSYGSNFKYVTMATGAGIHTLTYNNIKLNRPGIFFEPQATHMLSLKMLHGTLNGLTDPASIMISASVATTYFGNADPINKMMKIDDKQVVKVTGVYEDQPANSYFADMTFVAPWQLYVNSNPWMNGLKNEWGRSAFLTYVQIADNADMNKVSGLIKDAKMNKVIGGDESKHNPRLFLHPMKQWHLYANFKNGVVDGGTIKYVWLFGLTGIFVLLLACINFMNLSTAQSTRRVKEVGIRKAVGSKRSQLIVQFFVESLLMVCFSFILALVLVQLSLPFLNQLADKKMFILWYNPLFWGICICFNFFTGLLAGSYPAFYLSSFKPVKVLKGAMNAGRFTLLPRRVLVILQFSFSVTLIIGTTVVYRQIQYAKERPAGYNKAGLISMRMMNGAVHEHFDVVKNELLKSGAITNIAESGSTTTTVGTYSGGLEWVNKDPNAAVDFPNIDVSPDYGKTIGWQFKAGRDFSQAFKTDSLAFIINEAAVKYMGFKKPIGENITWNGVSFHVVGVIKDMVMQSPYQEVQPSMFHLSGDASRIVTIRLNPAMGANEALNKIEHVFKIYNPAQPFEYSFVDEQYARKFGEEQRIGQLSAVFASLAVLISCLGLFGMAAFMAEQRVKEIGVRKILGASIFNLWSLLSADFAMLVMIALVISFPLAYYFMHSWLQGYQYKAELSWWIFALAGVCTITITLLTVSFHTVKAALVNPVKSLRSE
ncbi:MAG: ABC transporter permease [Mucilaginibacter sp.]|uniref:ABC transporter permease n=1 Tax=Mucilaginibacter sp. TaxID=1882438 RepID=UPI0031B188A9